MMASGGCRITQVGHKVAIDRYFSTDISASRRKIITTP